MLSVAKDPLPACRHALGPHRPACAAPLEQATRGLVMELNAVLDLRGHRHTVGLTVTLPVRMVREGLVEVRASPEPHAGSATCSI